MMQTIKVAGEKRVGMVAAGSLRKGDLMVDARCVHPMKVKSVEVCGDGSVRITHELGDCRMTASVGVRVLH